MGWQLHQALYTKGFTSLNISRKESVVQDAGNTHHSLFGRIKFVHDRLPPFLKPIIHNPFLTFRVPSMNSIIKGESSNPKAGRDSQYKFILIDEAGSDKARWNIAQAWPSKYDPPDFSAKGNEVAIETLEIVHEGVMRVS